MDKGGQENKMSKTCEHKAGSRVVEGALVCVDCGKASTSPHWRDNVYGYKAEVK
jgi:hypothetical protein